MLPWLLIALLALPHLAHAADGQIAIGVHVTVAPRWLDPAETESAISPFLVLYAIHDALVKPMPAGPQTPCLAESWSASPDGLSYDFVLWPAKFHNGDPVTAEDVKFSFEPYRGGAAALLKEKVKEVRVVDPRRVRFVLKAPWPDFMTVGEMLAQIQRILADRVVFAPIWENAFLNGVGSRVDEAALTLVTAFPYTAPFDDLKLKR
jgi:peptide/nickel transport system substrate-binding protein